MSFLVQNMTEAVKNRSERIYFFLLLNKLLIFCFPTLLVLRFPT